MSRVRLALLLMTVLLVAACDIEDYPGLGGEIESVTGIDTSSPTTAATGVVNKMSGEPGGDAKEGEEFSDALGVLTSFKQQENEFRGDTASGSAKFGDAARHYRKALDYADDDPDKTFIENRPQRMKRAELYRKLAEAEQMQTRAFPGNTTPAAAVPGHLKAAAEAYEGSADNRDFTEQHADWAEAGRMYLMAGYTKKGCDALTVAQRTAQNADQRAWADKAYRDSCQ